METNEIAKLVFEFLDDVNKTIDDMQQPNTDTYVPIEDSLLGIYLLYIHIIR